MPKYIKCQYCGEKTHKSEITYVEGHPYCKGCVSEAEIYSDNGEEDYDDEEDDEEDDDDEDDDDDD